MLLVTTFYHYRELSKDYIVIYAKYYKMRAIKITNNGSFEQLTHEESPIPQISPTPVLNYKSIRNFGQSFGIGFKRHRVKCR